MIRINGNDVPSPSALRVSLQEIGGAPERSAAGGAVMDFVGARRTLKLRWARMGGAALSALLAAVDGQFFNVTYPDPVDGAARTAACWCASRSMGVMRMDGGVPVWTDIEMEWMER